MIFFQKQKVDEFERILLAAQSNQTSEKTQPQDPKEIGLKKKSKADRYDAGGEVVDTGKETLTDKDSISYYNRKYKKKAADTKAASDKPITIPGAFYKVRAQGGAAPTDSDEINKLNKRSIASFFVAGFHTYAFTNFLY